MLTNKDALIYSSLSRCYPFVRKTNRSLFDIKYKVPFSPSSNQLCNNLLNENMSLFSFQTTPVCYLVLFSLSIFFLLLFKRFTHRLLFNVLFLGGLIISSDRIILIAENKRTLVPEVSGPSSFSIIALISPRSLIIGHI